MSLGVTTLVLSAILSLRLFARMRQEGIRGGVVRLVADAREQLSGVPAKVDDDSRLDETLQTQHPRIKTESEWSMMDGSLADSSEAPNPAGSLSPSGGPTLAEQWPSPVTETAGKRDSDL